MGPTATGLCPLMPPNRPPIARCVFIPSVLARQNRNKWSVHQQQLGSDAFNDGFGGGGGFGGGFGGRRWGQLSSLSSSLMNQPCKAWPTSPAALITGLKMRNSFMMSLSICRPNLFCRRNAWKSVSSSRFSEHYLLLWPLFFLYCGTGFLRAN